MQLAYRSANRSFWNVGLTDVQVVCVHSGHSWAGLKSTVKKQKSS